jgi:hypothetical protein
MDELVFQIIFRILDKQQILKFFINLVYNLPFVNKKVLPKFKVTIFEDVHMFKWQRGFFGLEYPF